MIYEEVFRVPKILNAYNLTESFLWGKWICTVCVCVCGGVCVSVCIVDVSVSPVYFCGGFSFWIILFEETPHRKWTQFILKIRNNAEHTWTEIKWHISNDAKNIPNAK